MKKLLFLAAVAVVASMPARAEAALLTITDTFRSTNTVWTLDVQTSCTTCTVTLKAEFQDPDGAGGSGSNAYTGTYVDAVQFKIEGANPLSVTLNSTTAGTKTQWDFDVDESLSANQCNGGAADALCGQWIGGGTGGGFGPIENGSTLEWVLSVTFSSELPDNLTSGNIRAAFNEIVDHPSGEKAQNFNIFSPDGGSFSPGSPGPGTPGGTGPGQTVVPEPASLLLLGSGLTAAAWRVRRRKQGQQRAN